MRSRGGGLAARVVAVLLLAALAIGAGCARRPRYERGEELWHEVSYETTKLV